jgi:molybdopterin molybdotransferase
MRQRVAAFDENGTTMLLMAANITYEEAMASVLEQVAAGDVRALPLPEAVGEVLAVDVTAGFDVPPFPRATMDGYAVSWSGRECEEAFEVVATVAAGQVWEGTAGERACGKIMTGAAVPLAFDTVIPVEAAVAEDAGRVRFTAAARRGDNVAPRGEDARQGQMLIPRGSLLRTRHVPTLAAEGFWEVPVHVRPSVAVLATGDELREPWDTASPPCIRNTNAPFLMASLRSAGFHGARYLGIAPDQRERLLAKIRAGLNADFLLITGGVSMGDADLVPECLSACGVRKLLHKVSMKPGKPLFVGRSESGALVVGFPGNPVAVMVHFSMFVQPLLLKACGAREHLPKPVVLPLSREAVNNSGRKKFSLGRIVSSGGRSHVEELLSRGSGDFVSACHAEGIFEIPLGISRIAAGEQVRFFPAWGDFFAEAGALEASGAHGA